MNPIKKVELIQACLNKSTVNVGKNFESLIADKISSMLNTKKAEVANNIFNQKSDKD